MTEDQFAFLLMGTLMGLVAAIPACLAVAGLFGDDASMVTFGIVWLAGIVTGIVKSRVLP